jgi:hypothetical protein
MVQGHLAVHDGGAVEGVVADQHGAVEVGPVSERGQLRGGGDGDGGFGHAAEHHLQSEGAGERDHRAGFAQPGAFHELDIDAVEDAAQARHIGEALAAFVGDQGQGTAFAEPGGVVELSLGHRLLDEEHALGGEPFDFLQGLVPVGPALVGVDGDGRGGDGADGLDHHAVGIAAELHLDDLVRRRLAGLLAHDLGRIETDGEGGDGRLGGVEAPDPVPRGAEFFSDPVVQGDVHGGLGGGVARCEGVDGGEDFLKLERVGEAPEVELAEEGGRRGLILAEVGRHGGLAVAGDAILLDLDQHGGRGGAGVVRDVERVLELEGVGIAAQFHAKMAEGEGFEPPEPCGSAVFKTVYLAGEN